MNDQTRAEGPGLIGGRYETRRSIGQGGMGTVWLATDTVLGRQVAAKQIGAFPGETQGETRRAMREGRASAALNHPNVVGVYDVVEHEGTPWLVMEYVPGPTLSEAVRQRGPMTPRGAADLGAQLAGALAAAHRAGIVHRDVKPSNVLIGGGRPKLGDFGIARSGSDDQLTQTGLVTGTPSYMAPEVAEGYEHTAAADLWALGATLYFAVEGRDAYPAQGNPLATLRQVATQTPRRPDRAGPLEPVLRRLLAHDPAERGGVEELQQRLEALADGRAAGSELMAPAAGGAGGAAAGPAGPGGAPVPAGAGPRGSSDPDGGGRGRRWWVAALAAVLALVVAGGAALAWQGQRDQTAASSSTTPTSQVEPSTTTTTRTETTTATPTAQSSSSSSSSRSSSSSSSSAAEPDFPQAEVSGFVTSHFATVTEDPDQTWEALTADMRQAAGGKQAYVDFWEGIESVSASDVEVDEDTGQVDLTLTYTPVDGERTVEPKQLMLERQAGELKIDSERAR